MAATPLVLPVPPDPVGAYARGVVRGGVGFLSGQFPLVDGVIAHPGRLGEALTTAQGQQAAHVAALNALAQIDALLGGLQDLDGLLRLDGIIACVDGFDALPAVLDGASRLFVDALGDRGRHARSIVPVHRLPMDAPLELVLTFATRRSARDGVFPG